MDSLNFHPLTAGRWNDIVELFGTNGASGGCWCMWWKLSKSQFEKQKGEENKKAFNKIVSSNKVPGIIAYYKNEPVGWCAIEPRSLYKRLVNSRILKPVDEKPVWSIVCFFIKRGFRKKGVSVELLKAAISYAKKNKAKIVEGYPIDIREDSKYPDVFAYHGTKTAFEKAGFKEVLRRSETRPIMRCYL